MDKINYDALTLSFSLEISIMFVDIQRYIRYIVLYVKIKYLVSNITLKTLNYFLRQTVLVIMSNPISHPHCRLVLL